MDLSAIRLAICTDTYAPQINGVARTLMRLAIAVRARGGTVRIFTTDDPGATADQDVVRFASRPFWAYPQVRIALPGTHRLRRALQDFNPTLVHIATEFGIGLAARRAAGILGVPFVTSYHTNFAAYASHYRLGWLAVPGWHYLRWFHNGARRSYCPTESVRGELRQRGFQRVAVWSRGVDCERFAPAHRSDTMRAEAGVTDAQTLLVAHIGRLAPEKGVCVALEAMRIAACARPGKIRFLIGGDGPSEQQLRQRAPDGTCFLGRLEGDRLSAAFASADVFMFPSTTDTFGNVLLESMASGVPVIGADVGPTREVLGTDGWLVVPNDAPAMARQLIHLADHQDELRLMQPRARRRAEQNNWERIWDQLGADYLGLHRVFRP